MDTLPSLLLAGSLLGFYLAAWSAAGGPVGRGAASVWPLAGVCVMAAAMGQPGLGVAAAMGGALAAVGLVTGMVLVHADGVGGATETPTPALFLPPAVLAVMLVGLGGSVTPLTAVLLLVVAGAVKLATPGVRGAADAPTGVGRVVPGWAVAAQLLLATGVALLAGWAAVEAATAIGRRHVHAPAGLLAACVVGPAATLPLLGWCTSRAREEGAIGALSACVTYAMRCLLLLVPLVLLVHALRSAMLGELGRDVSVPFPPTLHRVEAVLMLALSTLLVAMFVGRFVPGRRDGVVLLTVYLAYIVLTSLWGAGLR